MSKSDVKMEDAEKHFHDSRNNVQESESKALDTEIEGKGESVLSAATASEDENKRDDGGEDVNKSRNEDKDKAKVNTEVKDLTNPENEGNEQIEGSIHEQTNAKSEHGKLFNTKTEDEEQPATISAVEEQIDIKNEVVQHNSTNGVDTEMKFTENSVDGGNHVKTVEEKPSVSVEPKGLKGIGKDNADCVEHIAGDKKTIEKVNAMDDPSQYRQLPTELSANKAPNKQNAEMDEVPKGVVEEIVDAANLDGDETVKDDLKEHSGEAVVTNRETAENAKTVETASKHDGEDSSFLNEHEAATPSVLVRHSPAKAGDRSGETVKSVFAQATPPQMGENDDGTPEEQTAFMKEIESFYRERAMDFKPPKFYGQPLNCLKLWRAVIRLGGYDRVTGSKLWRQVGESFHPPKTCTTVSWTFRIFYEKSLLEYERHKTQTGELQLPAATLPEASGIDAEGNGYQGSGSGRARRDAAARAMQGWHVQRLSDYGEVGEPIIKDKNLSNVAKREKNLKSIGSLKQKRPSEVEHSIKAARTETSKQLATSIVDVGPPADWVKINVRQTKDCFEVYALVPGLLREEVRVQSDPAGRVVITGQPEQVDNPWGISPFKKVISLPARINPLQTSAVVSLHGRLFVRVPFEQASM